MTIDLRSFLESLDEELIEIEQPVSAGAELASVVKALEPYGKPAALFTNVTGSSMPVLMGLFGKRRRIAAALGQPAERVHEYVLDLLAGPLPEPVSAQTAPVQERTATDLTTLPLATHSAGDAGPYITAGVTTAMDPRTGKINTGMYRMMVTGPNSITVNAAPDHDLGRILATAREIGERVPIAIVLGHHPVYAVASQLKNPPSVDAHSVVGAFLGEPLPVVPARTVDLPVPADAEVVIEGYVEPDERVDEGPFGEFSYYYGAANAPVCTVTAVTHRADAYFQDLHPTHAEHLCLWLFPGREARLLEAVRRTIPGTTAVRIPFYGGAMSAYLQLSKRRDTDGKQAILAAFAADHFLKHVTVVDEDIDIHDEAQVLWATNVRFQADRDLMSLNQVKGIRMDPSAHRLTTASGEDYLTAKLGLDATATTAAAFPPRADLPHPGYEHIELRNYLKPDTAARLADRTRLLSDLAE